MNSVIIPQNARSISGELLVAASSRTSIQARRDRKRKVKLVEGSGPHFTAETACLLQRRLRAAAMILMFGFGLFLVRRLFVDSPLWITHALLVVILAATIAILYRRKQYGARTLRTIEWVIFGLSTIQIAAHQYIHILQFAREGNQALALAGIKSTVIYFFALIVIYGMFVPNNWRRACAMVVPMTMMPIFVGLTLRLFHPDVAGIATKIGSFAQTSDNFLMLVIGAVCAVFGTHIINTLRREAFHAKELGQYRLTSQIGVGGMGEVFLAEHQLLKRPCAVKLIRPDKAGDTQTLRRFEREVRTTAKLSHPNTIEIYDYGRTEDGAFFYVMEYLPGLDLSQLVTRHGPLPADRVIYILKQVCGALSEAHRIGFIHRDIKPANIFSAIRGGMYDVVKLLDFGLVKSTQRQEVQLTHAHSFMGSPLYSSPEQSFGDGRPDARSDIYSLATVAYFLLTGRPPFDGENPMKIVLAHARDAVTPPSEIQAGVPQDLEAIVMRCLAKDPNDRFQDVQSLSRALASCSMASNWNQENALSWWQTEDWQAPPQRASSSISLTATTIA